MEVKSEFLDCDVDYMYCRCCFQLFSDSCNRYDFTFEFLSSLEDLFQNQLKLEGFDCSRWICEKCYEIVTNFRRFKNETLEKQEKFSRLIDTNQHKDLSKIRSLTETTDVLINEEILIKAEPLDNFPETIVIDMLLPSSSTEQMTPTKRLRGRHKKKEAVVDEVATNVLTSSSPQSEPVPKKLRAKYKKKKPPVEYVTPQPVYCKECDKNYLNIIGHQIRKHGLKYLYKCNKEYNCKFKTYDKVEFKKHKYAVHYISPRDAKKMKKICPYCAIPVSTIDDHVANVHFKERNFFCDMCDYSSYKREQLEKHIESQHMEKLITCNECGWKTSVAVRLQRHIDYMHKKINRAKNFPCKFENCNKVFETKYSLKYHFERIHEGSLNFQCDHPGCKKSFHTNVERTSHKRNVHGPRDVICDTCGKTFATLGMLKKHNMLHQDYKHTCSYCNGKFRNISTLDIHIKRHHTHIKDFKCNQCSAMYFRGQELTHHIALVHLGIRYHCQVAGCTSSLSRKDAYVTHLKSHNLDESEMKVIMQKCKEFMEENNLKR